MLPRQPRDQEAPGQNQDNDRRNPGKQGHQEAGFRRLQPGKLNPGSLQLLQQLRIVHIGQTLYDEYLFLPTNRGEPEDVFFTDKGALNLSPLKRREKFAIGFDFRLKGRKHQPLHAQPDTYRDNDVDK